jgi:mono/diheme cytochrome c family protein
MLRSNLLSASFGLLLVLGCNRPNRSVLEKGAGVFTRVCSGCHGFDGKGSGRPGFAVPPRDLSDAAYMSQLSDDQIRSTLRTGKGQMPAFGVLLEAEELDAVISYVRTLSAKR